MSSFTASTIPLITMMILLSSSLSHAVIDLSRSVDYEKEVLKLKCSQSGDFGREDDIEIEVHQLQGQNVPADRRYIAKLFYVNDAGTHLYATTWVTIARSKHPHVLQEIKGNGLTLLFPEPFGTEKEDALLAEGGDYDRIDSFYFAKILSKDDLRLRFIDTMFCQRPLSKTE